MNKLELQQKRVKRVRSKISGTEKRPRLAVFRTNKYIYGQVINDEKGTTLAYATSKGSKVKGKVEQAEETGEKIAEVALKAKVKSVVFDRRSYRYHGRVKAFADGARKGGLVF